MGCTASERQLLGSLDAAGSGAPCGMEVLFWESAARIGLDVQLPRPVVCFPTGKLLLFVCVLVISMHCEFEVPKDLIDRRFVVEDRFSKSLTLAKSCGDKSRRTLSLVFITNTTTMLVQEPNCLPFLAQGKAGAAPEGFGYCLETGMVLPRSHSCTPETLNL